MSACVRAFVCVCGFGVSHASVVGGRLVSGRTGHVLLISIAGARRLFHTETGTKKQIETQTRARLHTEIERRTNTQTQTDTGAGAGVQDAPEALRAALQLFRKSNSTSRPSKCATRLKPPSYAPAGRYGLFRCANRWASPGPAACTSRAEVADARELFPSGVSSAKGVASAGTPGGWGEGLGGGGSSQKTSSDGTAWQSLRTICAAPMTEG